MICCLLGDAVSCESRLTRLVVIVTRMLWPAAIVPDDGETVSWPIRLDGSEIDQLTGPPLALSVIVPPSSGVSTIVVGEMPSVPCAGGEGEAEEGGVDEGGADDGDCVGEPEGPVDDPPDDDDPGPLAPWLTTAETGDPSPWPT